MRLLFTVLIKNVGAMCICKKNYFLRAQRNLSDVQTFLAFCLYTIRTGFFTVTVLITPFFKTITKYNFYMHVQEFSLGTFSC